LHGLLILVGLSLTWSIIRLEDRPPAPIVEAGLPPATLSAVMEILPIELPGPGPAPTPPAPDPEPIEDRPDRQVMAPLLSRGAPTTVVGVETAFAGSDLPPGDLVFVLDASGTMIPWFHAVMDELDRTIDGMRDEDRFAVLLFRGSEAVVVPPGRLRKARDSQREAALKWLRDFRNWGGPAKGSDPVPALERAFELDPSTIVLFSGGMDASTSFSLDARAVLEAVQAAADAASKGRGHAPVIRCVQLVPDADTDPDPLLAAMAIAHGGGAVHLITPEELDP
jgi:hypothetical protein